MSTDYTTTKKDKFFQLLQNWKVDIALIKETHSKPDAAQKWAKEWPGKSLWHSGPIPKASGVAILLRENSDIDIISSFRDQKGSMLKAILQFEEEIFQIINIYAPTNTSVRKTFYITLQNIIEKNKNTILAGDLNMIENLYLDRLGGNPNKTHTIGIQSLNKIKNNHNLEDIWRRKNPYKEHFTYHNAENSIHSRLDRIYITKSIKAKSCNIIPTTISDHDSVSLSRSVRKNQRDQAFGN